MINLIHVINTLNRIAPPELAETEDKIGIQIGPINKIDLEKKNVRHITVSLDASIEAIKCAIENKSQLLVTHHPLFWGSLKDLSGDLLKKVRLLTSNYVNLFIVHTNWDCAENGTNDTLIHLLGLNKISTFSHAPMTGKDIPIGRICSPRSSLMSLKLLLEIIQDKINSKGLSYVGNLESEINKIVIISGSGGNIEFINEAIKKGADTFITGEASYHAFKFAQENEINLIKLGHYETENPGMRRLSQILQMELSKIKVDFFESKPVEIFI